MLEILAAESQGGKEERRVLFVEWVSERCLCFSVITRAELALHTWPFSLSLLLFHLWPTPKPFPHALPNAAGGLACGSKSKNDTNYNQHKNLSLVLNNSRQCGEMNNSNTIRNSICADILYIILK